MSLRINTNVAALNTHRQLVDSDRRLGISLERLSSGYRINQAKDDVAGLAIANKFRLEYRGLRMAAEYCSRIRPVEHGRGSDHPDRGHR